jgi:hypothetical protein
MKASEAKELCERSNEEEMRVIFDSIKKQAQAKCYRLWIDNPSDQAIEKLLDLGYKTTRSYGSMLLMVSWD